MLELPAPTKEEQQSIIKAALRAPDHGALRPWRFIWIEGDGRKTLAAYLTEAIVQEQRGDNLLAKASKMPLRAPVVLAVISSPKESNKIPLVDQRYSAAAAAQNVLLACESLGYASIWRTGWPVESDFVKSKLALLEAEEIVALVYIGTRKGEAREVPEIQISEYLSEIKR